jgi:hypothetical protein
LASIQEGTLEHWYAPEPPKQSCQSLDKLPLYHAGWLKICLQTHPQTFEFFRVFITNNNVPCR